MKTAKYLVYACSCAIFISFLLSVAPHPSFAQSNPCAQNPCAAKASKTSRNPCAANPCAVPNPCASKAKAARNPCAANPCAARNPCAANPCAPGARASGPAAKAVMVRGEIIKLDPGARKLVVRVAGKQLDFTLSKYSVVREGSKTKSLKEVKPGDKVTVSYVQNGGDRTAWYVYLAAAASVANPCGGNPCAVKNPCSARNPCAANPCATKAKR